MVFKRLRQATGVGGPAVDTVLADSDCRPGGHLEGRVQLVGGDHPVEVTQVALGLVTGVEVASGDSGYETTQQFGRAHVTGAFGLDPGQRYDVPFRFEVPWETPLTDLYGQRLPGVTMRLRTELEVARAVDQSDLDPVSVHPLPAQERLLEALLRLGFRFARAGVERGHLYGVHQTLPFYQEIEFLPAPSYAHAIDQLAVTFVTDPDRMRVVLEVDRRGGRFTEGGDAFGRFTVDHATVDRTDWAAQLDAWLRESLSRRGLLS
ncbi:sporulation protein [Micromonospora narathiwatensis]|uniref:Sporulation-control protein n=1 Tax=Micromonospora narathiwatensis TaxID=299146 RepID=A0A1A8Z3I1_9ACTN|nr:sporulation protein [Micromonospora narathiwatensis]SBT38335.1 sporulation-control protein [Micromonospora narathiwatensis]